MHPDRANGGRRRRLPEQHLVGNAPELATRDEIK
jgi:hypothetical protein